MKHINTIDLFSGTGSFTKESQAMGHTVHTFDTCPQSRIFFNYPEGSPVAKASHSFKNILEDQPFPDMFGDSILWASPPCESFSVASIGRHWHADKFTAEGIRAPKSPQAELGLSLLRRTVEIIATTKPKYWFIENPRGMMKKQIHAIFKAYGITDYAEHCVSYCQYGDENMKPTNIWTNCPHFVPRPMCKPFKYDKVTGEIIDRHCHHNSARRGSTTGIQGVSTYRDKSRVPAELIREVLTACHLGFYHDKQKEDRLEAYAEKLLNRE